MNKVLTQLLVLRLKIVLAKLDLQKKGQTVTWGLSLLLEAIWKMDKVLIVILEQQRDKIFPINWFFQKEK